MCPSRGPGGGSFLRKRKARLNCKSSASQSFLLRTRAFYNHRTQEPRMKAIALAIATSILTAIPALAEEPTFKCNITGSTNDGWEIKVTNSLRPYHSCTAECTLTLN